MHSSSSPPPDCAEIAPHLTALFDGEADAAQTDAARAHLLSCPACSRLWLDWTQHRATLQSEPVPAPPPTLLWRVLIAYRVAALAQSARRRSHLPSVSAVALRELEAPLPPRLSQHILARTTRKPNAHVMLTPLDGAPALTSARWNARATKFRRASLWAAPALALWILTLGRTNFTATLPTATPDAMTLVAPAAFDDAPKNSSPTANRQSFAPIPVLSSPIAVDGETSRETLLPIVNAPSSVVESDSVARVAPASNRARFQTIAARAPRFRAADETLNRALLLAMSAGKRDISRAETVTVSLKAPAISVAAPAIAESDSVLPPSDPANGARPTRASAISSQPAAQVAPVASARVSLAALTSPFTAVRTATAARVRAAVFSQDSMRPRATYVSANSRRLARALTDESATNLRVSRPVAGAPTLREVSFNGDSGPRLEDVRSAVDDFRASVAQENFGGE